MEKIVPIIMNNKMYASIIVIIIAMIIYQLIKRTINKLLEKDKQNNQRIDKKGRTVFKLISGVLKYVIIMIVIVVILQIYGINVNSLLAGLGIASVAVGLAIKDPLKDMISGMNIVSDDYFALGDVIRIDDIEGKVTKIGVRTTTIKDIKNGNIYVIANRTISKTLKISNELYLDIPLSYNDDIKTIEEVLNKAIEQIQKVEVVELAKYLGIGSFEESCIYYKIQINCKPEYKITIRRMANTIIKRELDKNGISIPFPQIVVHKGE